MPEPQIVIVVNSLTEAHKLERNLCGIDRMWLQAASKKMNAGFASTWGVTQLHIPNNLLLRLAQFLCVAARGYATTLKQIYRGTNDLWEWFDELERLRKAATPRGKHGDIMGGSSGSQHARIPDPDDDEVIKVADSPDITASDAAYIVAACNAVPMLVEMIEYLAGRLCDENHGDNDFDGKIQDAFEMTEPKE